MIKAMLMVSLICSGSLLPTLQEQERQIRREERTTEQRENSARGRNSRWTHSVDGHEKSVTIRDEVEFNDDYTDVINVSVNGLFQIKETLDGITRQLEIRRSANGELERRYTVGGAMQPYDAEARAWMVRALADALRDGFDAEARAQKILRRRGASAVLDEAENLTSDYARRIYLTTVLKSDQVDSGIMRRTLEQASRQLKSDYEKAELLNQAARRELSNSGVRASFFEVVGKIKSDYERGRVLGEVLNRHRTENELLSFVIQAASAISSDYEKANVLIKIAGFDAISSEARAAFLRAVNTIRSDYERKRVLSEVVARHRSDEDLLLLAIQSASAISSDYEKANVLMSVAETRSTNGSVRSALLEAINTIRSDYERKRALSAQ